VDEIYDEFDFYNKKFKRALKHS